jgi:hypothetical protein
MSLCASDFLFFILVSPLTPAPRGPLEEQEKQPKARRKPKIWMLMMKIFQSFYFYSLSFGAENVFPFSASRALLLPVSSSASTLFFFFSKLRRARTETTINYFYFGVKGKMISPSVIRPEAWQRICFCFGEDTRKALAQGEHIK